MQRVVALCQSKGALVLLDNKRGDIGSTATAYARASFGACGADAVTLSPYLGWDALEPFVGAGTEWGEKGTRPASTDSSISRSRVDPIWVAIESVVGNARKALKSSRDRHSPDASLPPSIRTSFKIDPCGSR